MPAFILLLVGFTEIFCSAFSACSSLWWVFAAAGSLLGIGILFLYRTKFRNYILISGCGVLVIAGILGYAPLKNGYYVLANEFLNFLTGKTGNIHLDYPADGTSGVYFAVGILTAFLALLLTDAVWRKNPAVLILLSLIAAAGAVYGFFPLNWGWIVLCGGIIYFVFLKYFEKMPVLQLLRTWTAGILALGICIGIAVPIAYYFPVHTGNTLSKLRLSVHQMRYDEGYNALPEGKLSGLGEFRKSPETALKVTMEQPQKTYFRGVIGDRYTGYSWESYDSELFRKSEDLFYWLHQSDFYVQSMIADAEKVLDTSKTAEMTVENISACREHLYLPYALAEDSLLSPDLIGDGTTPAGSEKQKFAYYPGSLPEWYLTAVSLAEQQKKPTVQEYLRKEESYRKLAGENDLQITYAVAGACQRILGNMSGEKTLPDILNAVKGLLQERLEYNELTVTHTGGNDFFSYVMEQSKQGYSVHYATAATLLLRYFGVPARYVEGYFLSAKEAEEYEPEEEILLTEEHAHAWTEFYLDGIGWIPFEVTPGYIDDDELEVMSELFGSNQNHKNDKLFQKNPLVYTPPKTEEESDLKEDGQRFHLEVKHVYSLLLLILLIGTGLLVWWILRRKSRLNKFLNNMKQADPRTAVLELYAYCNMLCQKFHVTEVSHAEEMKLIHQEARFSSHEIPDNQKEAVQAYTDEVVASCRKKCTGFQKLWYRTILSLYR